MEVILAAIAVILVSGVMSLILHRSPLAASAVSVVGIVCGCLVGIFPTIGTLLDGRESSLQWAWNVPSGSFAVGIDALSAVFLFIVFLISIPVSLFGASYLGHHRTGHNLGVTWFFTTVLIASMALVVVARNAVLFLVAWELMSVSSFFLVAFETDKQSARRAGLIYLIAAHVGAAFLLLFFLLLGRQSGSLDFNSFISTPALSGVLFPLALVGFGSKAGFMPLHVWLPEAHPAAPSHISALMSGVMIKMGIYGLVRSLTFLGEPSEWWGWLLLGIGVTSGVLGVLSALAQHDLKRLLAYHSVENIGIIAIGLGIGLLGMTFHSPVITILGWGGALLHVINHSLFKGLLFLGAGAVAYKTGTREIDRLGGLLKFMPWTGVTFLIGSVAICGLPPLNGFISEVLVYLGALHGVTSVEGRMAAASVIAVGGLALIGGLAVACFTKAFGIVFLGLPRTEPSAEVTDVGFLMKLPMVMLAVACLAIGLLAPFLIGALVPVTAQVSQLSVTVVGDAFAAETDPLYQVAVAFSLCIGLIVLLVLLRRWWLRGRNVREVLTWDCGYAIPNVRMQYTASSFAQPLTTMFRGLLRTRHHLQLSKDIFPASAHLESHTPDVVLELVFRPVFRGIRKALEAFRWVQHGNVHLYVLYILITLVILMFWRLP